MSAAVIHMPGALSIPVANRRHPGRPPKNVISIWKLHHMKWQREDREKTQRLEKAKKQAQSLHQFYVFHRDQGQVIIDTAVATLQQAGLTRGDAVVAFLLENEQKAGV